MKMFGLIGFPIGHSFSKQFFSEKFAREGIAARYELFPIETINDFPLLLDLYPELVGMNVTIPYKEQILPFLDDLDVTAREVGAVNTIHFCKGKKIGYNTDVIGFEKSLNRFFTTHHIYSTDIQALILGNGGAAKAVCFVLKKMNIPFQIVSRKKNALQYEALDEKMMSQHQLIINTTPLGMSPLIDQAPNIPYHFLTSQHILFDLIYNPLKTKFLENGESKNCFTKNGLEMLHEQALAAWNIWNLLPLQEK